jgi:hypothetical protein
LHHDPPAAVRGTPSPLRGRRRPFVGAAYPLRFMPPGGPLPCFFPTGPPPPDRRPHSAPAR